MTPTERQRIEHDAIIKYGTPRGELHVGYIDGAVAEHDKARNQAIDEAIEKIQIKIYNHPVNKDNVSTLDECIAVLESLKTIS